MDFYYSGIKGIKLYPTITQLEFLNRSIEGYKIVYNWALEKEYLQYNLYLSGSTDRSFLSFIDLQNLYPEFRNSNELLLYLPTHTMINAIKDMVTGYESFFKHKDLFNKPHIKNDKELYSIFRPRSEPSSFYFQDNMLRIEGLPYKETILTRYHSGNYLYDNIKYINPIIHRNNRTGEFTLSFVLEKPKLDNYFSINNIPKSDVLGVDVNKNIMYACSNGLTIQSVDISRLEYQLREINIKIQKDRDRYKDQLLLDNNAVLSNRAIERLNKRKSIYERISNIHKDTAYKGSLSIIRLNPKAVVLEQLDIKQIMSKWYIADDLQFHPLGIAQNILESQCIKYNIPVVYAPLEFQSSNICSNCGEYKDIGVNPTFICPKCGSKIQRDINAAINLKNWYINSPQ